MLHDTFSASAMRISSNIIRSFALESDNPVFRTQRFHDALKDYERYGTRTPNRIEFNLEAEINFIRKTLYTNEEVETELLLL